MGRKSVEYSQIVIGHFADAGYAVERVPPSALRIELTERGQLIRCIDPRSDRRTPVHHLGPAIPGGLFGLAYLIEDSRRAHGILARLDIANQRIIESGFRPSSHGDLENGAVEGCKFLKALTQKVFTNFQLSEAGILEAIRANGIEHTTLVGKADPIGIALNFEPNTTIIQRRMKYVVDVWYLEELGLNPDNYAPKLVAVADLLLAPERRRLILAA